MKFLYSVVFKVTQFYYDLKYRIFFSLRQLSDASCISNSSNFPLSIIGLIQDEKYHILLGTTPTDYEPQKFNIHHIIYFNIHQKIKPAGRNQFEKKPIVVYVMYVQIFTFWSINNHTETQSRVFLRRRATEAVA